MIIGIICAGDDELAPILSLLKDCICLEKSMLKFHRGQIFGIEAITLYSGAGKVNAAIATQILIDTFHCDIIINVGTAGGLADTVSVFDTVVAEQAAYYDMDEDVLTDFHPYLSSIWFKTDKTLLSCAKTAAEIFPSKVLFGSVVTGDKFVKNSVRDILKQKYNPLCADMETASVAHVCYVNKKPFIAIRSITDNADNDGHNDFEFNCKKASNIAAGFVKLFIEECKNYFGSVKGLIL